MTNPTPHGQVPEALRLAEMLTADEWPGSVTLVSYARECVAELRRLHAENERLSCLCDKWNSECDEFREDNKRLAAALARTVMLDQVSFDRKPDCYGIRQITDDESVEEWEDIRTSPDVAREEANDMMATRRGEIYEVVPLYTAPVPLDRIARDLLLDVKNRVNALVLLTSSERRESEIRIKQDIADFLAAPPAQEAQLNPDMPVQELRLHMGELTSDEVLVARAAIRWANSQK